MTPPSPHRPSPRRVRLAGSVLPAAAPALLVLLLATPRAVAEGADDFLEQRLPVGVLPQAVLVADLDGDGVPDLASADQFSSRVSLLSGLGDGNFAPALSLPVGSQPMALSSGDLDGDGAPDLLTANSGSSSVSVLLAPAQGGGPSVAFPSGPAPQDLAVGDVDGDGAPDVVVASDSLATPLSLLLGDGAGSLGAPDVRGTGFCAAAVRLADLDQDGLLDVVAADVTADALRVLPGQSGPAFGPPVLLGDLADPRAVAVADVDLDGLPDLLAANAAGAEVSLFLAQGGGAFAPATHHATGTAPVSVAVGDLDGDERPDLVTANFGSGDLSLLYGDGAGGFSAPYSVAAGVVPVDAAVADADGDFLDDVITANAFSNDLSVLLGQLGPWIDLGGSVAGQWGDPRLVASGDPAPDALVTLLVDGATPKGPIAFLVLGLERLDLPYKGGVFVPQVDAIVRVRPGQPVDFRWGDFPPPGSSVYLQAWIGANTPAGKATASNALRAVVQSP